MEDIRVAANGEDAEAVASILVDGFSDDPVMRWVFRPDDFAAGAYAMFHFIVTEATLDKGATYLCGDSAAAVWTPPNPEPWPEQREIAFVEAVSAVAEPAAIGRIVALDQATKAVHPQEPHWYLGMLATRCAQQGRGVGSQLMKECLAEVDAAGLPAYLESSNPRNVPFYERHGFRATKEIPLPDGPPLTAMWREASAS